MTSLEFRQNTIYTARLTEIFGDPIFQQALIILKDGDLVEDVEHETLPEIASVRRLSRLAGGQRKVQELIELALPLRLPEPEPEPDFAPPLTTEA